MVPIRAGERGVDYRGSSRDRPMDCSARVRKASSSLHCHGPPANDPHRTRDDLATPLPDWPIHHRAKRGTRHQSPRRCPLVASTRAERHPMKPRIAEWILSQVLPPDRAASTVGDWMEDAPKRGDIWFWSSVFRTAASAIRSDFAESPRFILDLTLRSSPSVIFIFAEIWYQDPAHTTVLCSRAFSGEPGVDCLDGNRDWPMDRSAGSREGSRSLHRHVPCANDLKRAGGALATAFPH